MSASRPTLNNLKTITLSGKDTSNVTADVVNVLSALNSSSVINATSTITGGSLVTAGNLEVGGSANIADLLRANNGISVPAGKTSNLGVLYSKATYVDSINVNGEILASSGRVYGNLQVGNILLDGNVVSTKGASFGDVTAKSMTVGSIKVYNDAEIGGNLVVEGNLAAGNIVSYHLVDAKTGTYGNLWVAGTANVYDLVVTHSIVAPSTQSQSVSASTGQFDSLNVNGTINCGGINIRGDANVGGNLIVDGNLAAGNIVSYHLVDAEMGTFDNGRVFGNLQVGNILLDGNIVSTKGAAFGDVSAKSMTVGTIKVYHDAEIGGNLVVDGNLAAGNIVSYHLVDAEKGTLSNLWVSQTANIYDLIVTHSIVAPASNVDSVTAKTANLETLNVAGAITCGSIKIYHDAEVGGNLRVDGNLAAGNIVSFHLVDADNSTFNTTAIASTLSVGGAATLDSTLDVTGATALSSTLDVTGATALSSTLDVTGATTLSSTLDVTGASDFTGDVTMQRLTVTGGAHINNLESSNITDITGLVTANIGSTNLYTHVSTMRDIVVRQGNDIRIGDKVSFEDGESVGDIYIGAPAGNPNQRIFIGNSNDNVFIRGNLTAVQSTSVEVTDSIISLNKGDVSSAIGAGLEILENNVRAAAMLVASNGNIIVTDKNNSIDLGNLAQGNFPKLYVSGASELVGAATLSSTLDVTGATTLSSTLDVTGATALSSTLDVTGATTLDSSLAVTGASTLSGATSVGSTLGVTGATTLSSTLTVAQATTLETTLNVTGSTSVGGTMTVDGATTINDNMTVNGNETLNGSLTATGNGSFGGNMSVSGKLDVSGNLSAANFKVDATLTGNVIAASTGSIDGNLAVGNILLSGKIITDSSASFGDLNAKTITCGTIKIYNDADVGGNLRVDGNLIAGNILSYHLVDADNGRFKYLDVTDTANIYDLYVTHSLHVPDTSADNLTVTVATVQSLNVSGEIMCGAIKVRGDAEVGGNLVVEGNLAAGNIVSYHLVDAEMGTFGNADIYGNLHVGNILLDGDIYTSKGASFGDLTAKSITCGTIKIYNDASVGGNLRVDGNLVAGNILSYHLVDADNGTYGNLWVSQTANVYDLVVLHSFTAPSTNVDTLAATTANLDTLNVAGTITCGSIKIRNDAAIGGNLVVDGNLAAGNIVSFHLVDADTSTFNSTAVATTLTVGTTLDVTGATTLDSTLGVSGAASLSSSLTVTGVSTFNSDVSMTQNATVTGTLTAHNIVSKDLSDILNLTTANIGSSTLYTEIDRLRTAIQHNVGGDLILGDESTANIYIGGPNSSGSQTIFLGNSNDKVVIAGSLTSVTTTNTEVTDAVITLNKGGLTHVGAGINIESAGSTAASILLASSGNIVMTDYNGRAVDIANVANGNFPRLYVSGASTMDGAVSMGNVLTVADTVSTKDIVVDSGVLTTKDSLYGLRVNTDAHFGMSNAYDDNQFAVVTITTTDAQASAGKSSLAFVRENNYVWEMGFKSGDNDFYIYDGGLGLKLTASNSQSWSTPSDARIKKNIETIDNSLERVMQMRGVYYNYTTDAETAPRKVGVIAQETYAALPELVDVPKNEEDYLTVRYSEIACVLINAIKELKVQNDALATRIAQLEQH